MEGITLLCTFYSIHQFPMNNREQGIVYSLLSMMKEVGHLSGELSVSGFNRCLHKASDWLEIRVGRFGRSIGKRFSFHNRFSSCCCL